MQQENPLGLVLIAGVYLADKPNNVAAIATELGSSSGWQIEQRWIAIGASVPSPVENVTVERQPTGAPKFSLINRLLRDADVDRYAYVLVCDDDIHLPPGFVDRYLAFVTRHDFALAQPARTPDSYIDHIFVRQLDGIDARRTNFVEIGPLFSVRRDALPLIVPFDEASPMGWGYDLLWPCVLRQADLKLGIVDAIPVAHTMRKPVVEYSWDVANQQQREFLRRHSHMEPSEAFVILEAYA